ncbi:peptide-methionine (S)-S-oxide reductase MsrA [Solwaraspora sp. WMMB335]|uniref:peptide-methionine (S)-S-oxide reductase MsrA n=1 Tax=Solwaraspora sp. WMMB335 TaxID=3404118 RepID=UPI003B9432A2
MFLRPMKASLPAPGQALPGRDVPMPVADRHAVLGTPLTGPWPDGARLAVFGMGCFWGAERLFWRLPGVVSTSVGYAGGETPNPTYEEVCSGGTGHAEVVAVVFDPARIDYADLLKVFWENHDPTQGMRQGNDVGTQYRSVIYTTDAGQAAEAAEASAAFAPVVARAVGGEITTEIRPLDRYYYAENYHQQYLHKNPGGYCNHGPNGMSCPVGVARTDG